MWMVSLSSSLWKLICVIFASRDGYLTYMCYEFLSNGGLHGERNSESSFCFEQIRVAALVAFIIQPEESLPPTHPPTHPNSSFGRPISSFVDFQEKPHIRFFCLGSGGVHGLTTRPQPQKTFSRFFWNLLFCGSLCDRSDSRFQRRIDMLEFGMHELLITHCWLVVGNIS